MQSTIRSMATEQPPLAHEQSLDLRLVQTIERMEHAMLEQAQEMKLLRDEVRSLRVELGSCVHQDHDEASMTMTRARAASSSSFSKIRASSSSSSSRRA